MTAVAADRADGLRLVFWIETGIGEGLSDPVYVDLPDLRDGALVYDRARIEGDIIRAFWPAYQDAVGK